MLDQIKDIPDKFWLMAITTVLLAAWILSDKDPMVGTMLTAASGATLLALKGKQVNVVAPTETQMKAIMEDK